MYRHNVTAVIKLNNQVVRLMLAHKDVLIRLSHTGYRDRQPDSKPAVAAIFNIHTLGSSSPKLTQGIHELTKYVRR